MADEETPPEAEDAATAQTEDSAGAESLESDATPESSQADSQVTPSDKASAAPGNSNVEPIRTRFDPMLLDRMTGRLGDRATIETRGRQLQVSAAALFETAFHRATGLDVAARLGTIETGRRRALTERFLGEATLCTVGVKGLSDTLTVICGTSIVIALVECLLGGADADDLEIVARPLSKIELDMSLLVFEQFSDALRICCSSDTKVKAVTGQPMASMPAEEDDPVPDDHSAAIRFDVELGPLSSPLTMIIPQAALLKARIKPPVRKETASTKGPWAEKLSERVQKSEVGLQASIQLEPLRLSEISRLVPGDVLPFLDTGDAGVMLSANGKLLYRCALGRNGQKYMVRVEGPAGAEEDWRKAIC